MRTRSESDLCTAALMSLLTSETSTGVVVPSCVRRVSLLGDDRQEAVNLCARILRGLHLLQCLTVQPHGFKEKGGAHLSPRSSLLHYLPAASVQMESSSTGWDTMVASSAYLKSVSGYCRFYCLNPLELSHVPLRCRAHRKQPKPGTW